MCEPLVRDQFAQASTALWALRNFIQALQILLPGDRWCFFYRRLLLQSTRSVKGSAAAAVVKAIVAVSGLASLWYVVT